MAIVGPRPLLPETIEGMEANGAIRCSVRPGLTGWAQISGGIKLNNDDKLALDLWYIENRSFLLDLKIVSLTPTFLILGDQHNKRRLNLARQRRRHLASNDNLKKYHGRRA
jgi:lipopolysaccharide/colanic/teichoic acid biosynthesis glycosyltransferase